MSFGLARGRELSVEGVGLFAADLPRLPDGILADPPSGWIDPRGWFPDPDRPLEVEIGSGKGAFLLQQGEADPDTNYLGIEYAAEFFRYAADRVRRRGLPNVRLLCADAAEFLRWRLPSGIVRVIHLYFPDPWPKTRHHRRRMMQDSFLEQAHRVLVPGGEVRIVTDHADYWAWMEDVAARNTRLFERLAFERPGSAREGETVGTNFERKYAREGRPFYAMTLRRVEPSP